MVAERERGRLAVLVCALPMAGLAWARWRWQLPLGDEPHYLVISQALARYGSLDVGRVYDHRDYWSYYPVPLAPHVVAGPGGSLLPLHAIGGPVLWLAPFALAGRAGVLAFMVVVSLLVVANLYRLARELAVGPAVAAAVAVAFGLGTPLLTYAAMSFVEPVGALGCVLALRVLHQRELRARDLALASAALWVLPWVHGRYLLFPPVLTFFLVRRVWREDRSLWAAVLVPAGVLLTALAMYDLAVWHTLSPVQNQVGGDAVPFRIDPLPGLVGIVFDQEVGVVPNFPVVLFVLPGLLLAANRPLTRHVLAVAVPYVVVVCSFPAWAGAYSPPARFLAVVLPLFAGHVAIALERARGRLVFGLLAVLTGVGALQAAVAVGTATGGFSAQTGRSPVLAEVGSSTGLDLTPYVPSSPLADQQVLFLAWFGGAVAFAVAVGLHARHRDAPATTTRWSNPRCARDGVGVPGPSSSCAPPDPVTASDTLSDRGTAGIKSRWTRSPPETRSRR